MVLETILLTLIRISHFRKKRQITKYSQLKIIAKNKNVQTQPKIKSDLKKKHTRCF